MGATRISAEVVICGAGMAGIAAAYHLAVRGGVTNIVLVDEREPLTLTSNKGTEAYRNWWPGPGDTMVCFVNRSIDLFEELARATDNYFQMNRRGYVFLTADDRHIPIMKAAAAETSALGAGPIREHPGPTPYLSSPSEGFEGIPTGVDLLLSPDLVREQFPFVAEDTVAALHVRRAGWLDAQKLGKWLLAEVQRAGVRLVRDRVTDVTVTDNRVTQVHLQSGDRINTGTFVIAAGPYLKEVGAMIGVDIPVFNELHGKIALRDELGIVPTDTPLLFWSDPINGCLGLMKNVKSWLRMTRLVGCSMNFPLVFISGHAWTAIPMCCLPFGLTILNLSRPFGPPRSIRITLKS